jgi:hypothetical protein
MTSPLKSATARLNGAKSRGPKTAAGLEKSSRNALKHGFRSVRSIVVDPKDHPEFQQILDGLVRSYRPATPAEKDQVDRMAAASWRIRRLSIFEASLFSAELSRQKSEHPSAHPDAHLIRAFRALADDRLNSLALTLRYQSQYDHLYDRACHTLHELMRSRDLSLDRQGADPSDSRPKLPNEPTDTTINSVSETRTRSEPKHQPVSIASSTNPAPDGSELQHNRNREGAAPCSPQPTLPNEPTDATIKRS